MLDRPAAPLPTAPSLARLAAHGRRQAGTRGYLNGTHVLAGIGVAFWIIGAVLVFMVGGGLWSDVPGGALLALGVAVELVATLVIVGRRARRG